MRTYGPPSSHEPYSQEEENLSIWGPTVWQALNTTLKKINLKCDKTHFVWSGNGDFMKAKT